MIPTPGLYDYVLATTALLLSMICHELGHITAFRAHLGYWPRIRLSCRFIEVGQPQDYQHAKWLDKVLIYAYGPLLGLVPILTAAYFTPWAIPLLLLWAGLCSQDFKALNQLIFD